ncbi:MAG: tetratricopeptide repeat protein [Planctomycetes bacterium]|nr:tetratricopeptide repeat protein [Planctomycetota bacterium]
METEQFEKAVAEFIAALRRDSSSVSGYFGLAQSYNRLGWTDREIEAYSQLLVLDPQMAAALQNLGNAYMTKELYDDAAGSYIRAIAAEPGNTALHYNLAVAYSKLEMYDESVAESLAAIELDPGSAEAHNAAAIGYYMLKQRDQARRHVQIAKQLGFAVQKQLLEALGE